MKFNEALMARGGKLGEFCQVLFMLTVANTDDFGRMSGDAFTVKHVVLPASRRPQKDFDRALNVLADVGLIDRYTSDGAIYLQIQQFDAHQPNLHKRSESKFPGNSGISGKARPNIRESNLTQNPEPRTQNPEPRQAAHDSTGFTAFWAAYPKKKAKDDAKKAWDKRHPDAALVVTILSALGQQSLSADWLKEHGRYIPFPATWLNRGQWTDHPDALASSRSEAFTWVCPHTPRCPHRPACEIVSARKAR